MNDWLVAAIAFAVGALICRLVAARFLRDPPAKLMRTNVDGHPVPAVLGWAVVSGVLAAELVWAINQYRDVVQARCVPAESGSLKEMCPLVLIVFSWTPWVAFALLTMGMFVVGLWDDLKGAERPRGFAGHLSSLRQARWTGGLVKLVGGGLTALVAVGILGNFRGLQDLLLLATCTALAANVINLFDRAPGRALKVFLLAGIPLALLDMIFLLGGAIGASVAALPIDLKARAMLGDAGANPLGALLGLGAGLQLGNAYGTAGLFALFVVLLAVNLASEKWSFSEVIAKNRVLAWLDHLGRE